MCRGLSFTQPESRRPAAYGASSFLTTTPSNPSATARRRPRCLLGGRRRPVGAGPPAPAAAPAAMTAIRSRQRLVQQVAAVDVQQVEAEQRQRRPAGTGRRVGLSSRVIVREAMTWKVSGRPSVTDGQHLAVQHDPPDRQRGDHATISGTRSVMSSRLRVKTPDGVAVAVHLHPDAVQLDVDDRGQTGLDHGAGDVGRAGRQHRPHRLTHRQRPPPPAPSSPDAASTTGRGGGRTEQHRGPLHRLGRHAERLGQAVLHQRIQRALPDLVEHQARAAVAAPARSPGRTAPRPRRSRERRRTRPGRARRSPRTPRRRRHGQRRFRGRLRDGGQRGPADTGPPLPQDPGQVGHHQGDLGRLGGGDRGRDEAPLGQPGAGAGDVRGRRRESGELHQTMVTGGTDSTESARRQSIGDHLRLREDRPEVALGLLRNGLRSSIGVATVIDVENQDFSVSLVNGVAHPVLAAAGPPLTGERW